MAGKIETHGTAVWCPAGHYLGSAINLVTGRALFCPRCGRWFEWQEIDVGKREPKK